MLRFLSHVARRGETIDVVHRDLHLKVAVPHLLPMFQNIGILERATCMSLYEVELE